MSDGAAGFELAIDRVFDAPVAAVWRAMTDHTAEWWCPRPWTTEIEGIEWRPGGRFDLTMLGPAGESAGGPGMLLAVEPERQLVFTNLMRAGWVPQVAQPVGIIGVFTLTDLEDGRTGYRAAARHATAGEAERHAAMGFEQGWGVVAAQLEAVARGLA